MKRGNTWSYVIRVKDPETGESKPKWVSGFATEDDAKAARDEARVKLVAVNTSTATPSRWRSTSRSGSRATRSRSSPRPLPDNRVMIRLYIEPRIGKLRLQALRPATITKLYRDLLTTGGRNCKGLAPNTIKHVHTVLRKALADAVLVDEILPSNPAEQAKLPRTQVTEPGTVWTPAQLREFLDTAKGHRLFAFFRLAAYSGARRGELCNLRWADVDLDAPQIRLTGSSAVVEKGSRAQPRAADPVS